MRHKHIRMALCAASAIVAAGCSNAEYELENLFPKEYHSIVYIQEDTDDGFVVYDIKEQTSLTFNVIKAGSGPSLAADVALRPATEAELDSLRKDYTIVPSDCYNAPSSVHLDGGQEYAEVSVGFNLDALKKFVAADKKGKPVAVAFRLAQPSTATINGDREFLIRTLSIEKPTLAYPETSMRLGLNAKAADLTLKLGITNNKWNFTCALGFDDAAKRVADYNKANGTRYELLPTSAYKLSADKFAFKAGSTESVLSLSLTDGASALSMEKTYLLPVHVAGCTQEGVNLPTSDMFVTVSGQVLMTLDMLSSPCTQGDDGAGLPGLIDGNTGTFWQSVWKTQYLNAEFGHYFDVHLPSAFSKEMKFAYTTRDYAPVLPIEIKISVSPDGNKWTTLATLTKDRDGLCDVSGRFVSKAYKVASDMSYVRYSVMKTNTGRPGVDGSASTAITGFELWVR